MLNQSLTDGILIWLLGENEEEDPALILDYSDNGTGYIVFIQPADGDRHTEHAFTNFKSAANYFLTQIPD